MEKPELKCFRGITDVCSTKDPFALDVESPSYLHVIFGSLALNS